ncbi:hypothetical protein [Acinetobacter sp. YH12085]|uniref:hypothetical protein n=1 Tax=Acinetobacter sp. YH12085 TaxID=2601077 RepID=UPI0015D2C318|nr:hypothetical protein [Acinetobacter sp. YH12085]
MQTNAYVSRVHIAVPRRLKPTVLLLAASLYLSGYSYAMDDAQFEQQHQQLLQDAYWAQVAEHNLKKSSLINQIISQLKRPFSKRPVLQLYLS